MKKLLIIFLLSTLSNLSFSQNLCHEGSGGGPCMLVENLEDGTYSVQLGFEYSENCECPSDISVLVGKNPKGIYSTTYGSYNITLIISDNWVVNLKVSAIKSNPTCCKLAIGDYYQPGE